MRHNPPAKWPLPVVLRPTTSTAWCIPVPDDPAYRAAFLGAIQQLGAAYKWADDPDHNALVVAQVWRNIADALEKCIDETPVIRFYEDETMPIRVDCDCNVFVTCCDGTEIQLATLASVRAPTQPGTGTRPPIGQSACFPVTLNAKNTWLLPFSVSRGDVITVSDISGAWSDDSILWTCPDGTPFIFGHCTGSRYHVTGDPSGTLYHGQLALLINGVYYSATDGAFTVPSGVANQQCTLLANFERSLSNAGDITFKVCVANGATPPLADWCADLDFTASDFGFMPYTGAGGDAVWVPGAGWSTTLVHYAKLDMQYNFTGAKIIRATSQLSGSIMNPNLASGAYMGNVAGGAVVQYGPIPAGAYIASGGGTDQNLSGININVQGSNAGGIIVARATIYGDGAIPSGWTPC